MGQGIVRRLLCHTALAVVIAILAGSAVYTSDSKTVRLRDRCDPESFNFFVGPGTCVEAPRGGEVDFLDFIAEVTATGSHPKWAFKPDDFHVEQGESVNAENQGGEVHTFTPVAAFGNGFVPPLNTQGNGDPTVPIPECDITNPNAAVQTTFVPPATEGPSITLNTVGTQKFQCCIHPWMRTEVEVREK